jgi:hypothetical protein
MTTSFTLNASEGIEKGIRLSGGNPSQAEELQSARTTLNLLQQEWTTRGINLWKLEPIEIPLPASTAAVSISSDVLDVVSLVIRTSVSGAGTVDYQAQRIGFKDYLPIINKDTTGRPTQYAVERLKDNIRITLWPVPENDSYSLYAWAINKFDDINRPTDYPDAPAKYMPALVYGLGYYMGVERSDGTQEWENKLNRLKGEYDRLWNLAFEEDQERAPFRIVPSTWGHR